VLFVDLTHSPAGTLPRRKNAQFVAPVHPVPAVANTAGFWLQGGSKVAVGSIGRRSNVAKQGCCNGKIADLMA
jgi:hypothetical protein